MTANVNMLEGVFGTPPSFSEGPLVNPGVVAATSQSPGRPMTASRRTGCPFVFQYTCLCKKTKVSFAETKSSSSGFGGGMSGWVLRATVLITLTNPLIKDGNALVSISFGEIQEERGLNNFFITPNSSSSDALFTLSCPA